MSISVNIHKTHRHLMGDNDSVDVEGRTIGDCLRNLTRRYPGLEPVLFDKKGNLNSLLEVYLNLESTYPDELKKPVKDGDEIQVTLLLSGG